jgi:hypothetical protein
VCNITNAAKNVVQPLVDELFIAVQKARETELIQGSGINRKIVYLAPPNIIYDDQFLGMLEEYKDIIYYNSKGASAILATVSEKLSTAQLRNIAMTGSPVIDDKLSKVYSDRIFDITVEDSTNPSDVDLTTAIKFFMMLNGIINYRSNEFTNELEDTEFKLRITFLRDGIGGALYRLCKMFTDDIVRGDIFCANPRFYRGSDLDIGDPTAVYVHSATYQKWITTGGSVEALLGYVFANKERSLLLSITDLFENPTKFVSIYNSQLQTVNIANALNEINVVKKTAHRLLQDHINKTFDKSNPELIMYHDRLGHAIEHDYHGPNDLMPYLIKVVSRTLFPCGSSDVKDIGASDVKDVLLEVYSETANVENPDYAEALLLSVIRLVCKVLTRDLVVSKDGG